MLFFKHSIEAEYDKYTARVVPHLIMVISILFALFPVMIYDLFDLKSKFIVYISLFFIIMFATLFSIWIKSHPVFGLFGVNKNVDFIKEGGLAINFKNPLIILVKEKVI